MEKPKTLKEACEKTIAKWKPRTTGILCRPGNCEDCPLCLYHGYSKVESGIVYPSCSDCLLGGCHTINTPYRKYSIAVSAGAFNSAHKAAQQIVDTCQKELDKIKAEEKKHLVRCNKSDSCRLAGYGDCYHKHPHERNIMCSVVCKEGQACIPVEETEKAKTETFYMIYVEGQRGPTFKHLDAESAITECARLAKHNPNTRVYRLKAETSCICKVTSEIKWEGVL